MKDELIIKIDLKSIRKHIDKYIKRKVMERLKEEVDSIIDDVNYPRISVHDNIEDIEKLIDWKRDIEQGWIDISKYCNKRIKNVKHKPSKTL